MLLHLAAWPEVEDYLKRSTGIIIPIGSTEQHGPTGLIGTDAITAEAIGAAAGDKTGALVGPTISVGMALHHLGFTGSISLRPTTLIAYIHDYVLSLARAGFTRFFFVNGHGGNVATANAAFAEITAEAAGGIGAMPSNRPEIRCKLVNWWDFAPVKALSRDLYGNAEGMHATASEVSVTQYLYRDHIKPVPAAGMSPRIAPVSHFFGAADYRRRFPDGRIGSDPTLSRPEHGERIHAAAATAVADAYQTFVGEA